MDSKLWLEAGLQELSDRFPPTMTGGRIAEAKSRVTEALEKLSNFEITDFGLPDEIIAGEEVRITATIANTWGVEATQTVSLKVDDLVVAIKTVTLDFGTAATVQFNHAFSQPGGFTIGVLTSDDAYSVSAQILAPAIFQITSFNVPEQVKVHQEVDFTATISNVGGLRETKVISLTIDDIVIQTQSVTLDPGNQIDIQSHYTFSETGAHTVSLKTPDAVSSKSILVAATCPPVIFPRATKPPNDLDGDGLCEDTNGNKRLDFDDAVTLALNIGQKPSTSNPEFFDFNRNRRMDFDDAVTLARSIGGQSAAQRLREMFGADRLKVFSIEAFPNPVRATKTVQFKIDGQGIENIRLEVFNLSGRRVFGGDHNFIPGDVLEWPLMDSQGKALANGVYLYVVIIKGYNGQVERSKVGKLVILR